MDKMESVLNLAEAHCTAAGKKLTIKRRRVLMGLLSSEKALSAYDIVDFFKSQFEEDIPAMSVYRILDFLESQHLVHKIHLANKYVACAHIDENHTHNISQFLVCGKCSKVKETPVKATTIKNLKVSLQGSGFRLATPQLEIPCICDDCT